MEAAVGAATWPVGAQVWNGQRPAKQRNDEHEGERPHLELARETVRGKVRETHRLTAGEDESGHQPHKDHCTADEGIEGQFHRGIFAPG
jgi:hypothetical protein